jgi:hypothetical protein
MRVKQISVFIENTSGSLAEFTGILGDHHIDLVSLSIADTANFGILRGIVADYQHAYEVISNAGYTVRLTDVLAAYVPDKPGGLANVLGLLSRGGIGIEYLYSFIRQAGNQALLIFRVEEIDRAEQILTGENIRLLSQEEVGQL